MRFCGVRAAVVLLLVTGLMIGCGGASGPTASKLEANHDIAGLLEMATGPSVSSGDAVDSLRRLNDPAVYDEIAHALRGESSAARIEYPERLIPVLGLLGGPRAVTIILDWVHTVDVTTLTDQAGTDYPHGDIVVALARNLVDATGPLLAIIESPRSDPSDRGQSELRRAAFDVFDGLAFQLAGVPRPASTGPLGSDRVEQVLLNALRPEAPSAERAGLAIVRRRVGDPALLLPLLETPSTVTVYDGLIRLGLAGTEPALVAALERNSEDATLGPAMAKAFYASGNDALKRAAESWATAHGFALFGICAKPSGCTPTWATLDFYSDG